MPSPPPDPRLGARWAHDQRIMRAERTLTATAGKALDVLLDYTRRTLAGSQMNPDALDAGMSGWATQLRDHLVPAIGTTYHDAFAAASRAPVVSAATVIDPSRYATGRLTSASNRLTGVPDDVFGQVRTALDAGRVTGETVPQLAKRVDGLLSDTQRWKGRAVTIARTEVIGANNAGSYDATSATAGLLGHSTGDVVKEWLATSDSRTRESHADADGQQVVGMDTPFDVGGSELDFAGDPGGDPGEVINCRCTVLYHYPGDPDYPDEIGGEPVEPAPSLPADPSVMDVTAIDAEVSALMAAGDYDSPRFEQLAAEMDARDAAVVELPDVPDPIAEQDALDELLRVDPEAVMQQLAARDYGELTDSERRLLGQLEQEYGARGRGGASKTATEADLRDQYATWLHTQWLRAEDETRGVQFFTREGEALAAKSGGDLATWQDQVFQGKRSLKYVSPELQEWFAQPGNQRLSYPEFRAGLVDDRASREAGARLRNRGYESEHG